MYSHFKKLKNNDATSIIKTSKLKYILFLPLPKERAMRKKKDTENPALKGKHQQQRNELKF